MRRSPPALDTARSQRRAFAASGLTPDQDRCKRPLRNITDDALVANNHFGPNIDRTGVATPPVNGPAANSTLATTDANANSSY